MTTPIGTLSPRPMATGFLPGPSSACRVQAFDRNRQRRRRTRRTCFGELAPCSGQIYRVVVVFLRYRSLFVSGADRAPTFGTGSVLPGAQSAPEERSPNGT